MESSCASSVRRGWRSAFAAKGCWKTQPLLRVPTLLPRQLPAAQHTSESAEVFAFRSCPSWHCGGRVRALVCALPPASSPEDAGAMTPTPSLLNLRAPCQGWQLCCSFPHRSLTWAALPTKPKVTVPSLPSLAYGSPHAGDAVFPLRKRH